MKQRFIVSRYGVAALVLLSLFMLSLLAVDDLVGRFDLPLYDLAMRQRKASKSPVTLVPVDRRSLGVMGAWPWPRRKIASLVDRLYSAGAKNVALAFSLAGQERSAVDLALVEEILIGSTPGEAGKKLRQRFNALKKKFDGDLILADSLGRGGSILGLHDIGSDSGLPPWFTSRALTSLTPYPGSATFANPWPAPPFTKGYGLGLPAEKLARSASGVGHRIFSRDYDGVIRRQPVFVRSGGQLVPSLALSAFLDYRGKALRDLRGVFGTQRLTALFAGQEKIPLVSSGEMLIDFASLKKAKRLPAAQVMSGKKKPEGISGSLVIVGPSIAAGAAVLPTPAGDLTLPEIESAAVATLLAAEPLARPPWAWLLELGVMAYLFFFVALAGPRMSIVSGTVLFSVSALVWMTTAFVLLVAGGVWFRVATPVLPAIIAYVLVFLYRKFSHQVNLDPAVIEDNKKVGLAFQSHGLLDLAMERFMRLPAADPVCRELLYNLGLDLERKRMFAKGIVVYEKVEKHGGHRDSRDRLARVRQAARMPGLASPLGGDATTAITGGFSAPTIGRYEVVRELGQGAIGTVYLGRDPKINREVAIKTLRTQEVASDDLEEVRERFFREAEAAGSLNHPNIVTIYDIGEDDDMTYIAMELLSGRDLSHFCRRENLLPVDEVLRIIVQVASALDYAHKNKVVHRDIKPANIVMMDDGQVKVADFGIARLQAASTYTRTGAILGTPNYMSPEQVSGKKVDGRSDLFSLGVVFYELLTGIKPFRHENVATLMHTIGKVSYQPLVEIRDDLPSCCYEIMEKLLTRAKSHRFQSAGDLAEAARECLATMGR